MKFQFVLPLLLAALILAGCNTQKPGENQQDLSDMEIIETISQGTMNAMPTDREREGTLVKTIRSTEDFSGLWSQMHSQLDEPDMPEINFDDHMLIVALMGEKPSSGYEISIDSVEMEENELIAHITETEPGATCMVLTVITNPHHVVKVPASDREVTVRTNRVVNECE